MFRIAAIIAASFFALSLAARDLQGPDSPVSVVVTVKPDASVTPARLTVDDVLVTQNKQRMQVTALEPLRSQNGLQLWILIDDGSSSSLGAQLADIKKFVAAQSASTEIGIGYMQNGAVRTAQALTSDHDRAVKALRLPMAMAGISASPYIALESLIHHWPVTSGAREVLMVSSGIDPEYGSGPDDPYVNSAIHTAQRAGVVVYAIYYSGAGRWAHAYRQLFWGQNYLAQLSGETGGELYWLGMTNPVSIVPYLDDLSRRLNSQYLLTFMARPENKPGLQPVKIKCEQPHVKLSGPSQVYVQ